MVIAQYFARWIIALGLIGALLWLIPIPWDIILVFTLVFTLPVLAILHITGLVQINAGVRIWNELAEHGGFRATVDKIRKGDIQPTEEEAPTEA